MSISIVDVLNSIGKETRFYTTPDGTRVLVLPYGGRVLGLYTPGSDEDFFWTNTALENAETAKEFYESNEWHNSGGERTWLSPEVDLFFPESPNMDMSTYFQPRQLDPGNYRVVATHSDFRMVNDLEIRHYRSKQKSIFRITKTLSPAPNPLRYEKDVPVSEYAGYTQTTSLELLNSDESEAQVGLWDLTQLPHGGDLLVPTYSRTEPRVFFGPVTNEDLVVEDNLIKYRMRTIGDHKIGIRAVTVTGRIGYMYPIGDQWALVIRNFAVNPSGEYVDAAWDDVNDSGYAVQACNLNGDFGMFSEIEYHMPAIGLGTGQAHCEDISQAWAFRSSRDAIIGILKKLLSAEI